MVAYEQANNSHVWANVAPFIADDATYWFTDGSYAGIADIRRAVQATFDTIRGEVYKIADLHWPLKTAEAAVCTYRFAWHGTVNGVQQSGTGRGTNLIQKRHGSWRIVHEHLSA